MNDEPDSDKTNYSNIESQAYEKLFEFIFDWIYYSKSRAC